MDHRHFVLDVMMVMVPVETIGMAVAMVMAVMVLVAMTMVMSPSQSAMVSDEGNQKNEGRDDCLFHGGTSESQGTFFSTHFSCHGYRERKPSRIFPPEACKYGPGQGRYRGFVLLRFRKSVA